jgi:hypothetical protein
MVEVTYHCPHCGAVTALERDGYLDDKSVTAEPLDGWEYAATTDDFEDADGVELVCLGNGGPAGDEAGDDAGGVQRSADWDGGYGDPGPDPDGDGCGRTFYLNFVTFDEEGERQPPGGWLEEEPNFDFLRR